MSTDWRSLAAELAAELERCRPLAEVPDCLARARAALAAEADGPAVQSREPASVVGEPSDDELLKLSQFHCVSITLNNGSAVSPFVEGTDIRPEVLSFARAAISRWGHQPAPPTEGEVGELVAWLRLTGEGQPRLSDEGYARLTRAADLLERRHPAPVPVAERLPGPEDCDALGYCWWWDPFRRESWEYCITGGGPDWYWLPATALPLPQGEVK